MKYIQYIETIHSHLKVNMNPHTNKTAKGTKILSCLIDVIMLLVVIKIGRYVEVPPRMDCNIVRRPRHNSTEKIVDHDIFDIIAQSKNVELC